MSSSVKVKDENGNWVTLSLPDDFRPGVFKDFCDGFFQMFKAEQRVTAPAASEKLAVDKETAKNYLEFMYNKGLIKADMWRPRRAYYVGCPRREHVLADLTLQEGTVSEATFHIMKRFSGFFRPAAILLSDLDWGDKAELIRNWYETDGYYVETHLLAGLGLPALVIGSILLGNELEFRANSKDQRRR